MKRVYSFVILLFLIGQTTFAQQNAKQSIQDYFNDAVTTTSNAKSSSSNVDFKEWMITDKVPSLKEGIMHYYVLQLHNNIPIVDGTYKFTMQNNKITYALPQFIEGVKDKIVSAKSSSLTEEGAIGIVARRHNLSAPARLSKSVSSKSSGLKVSKYLGSGITIDNEPIEVQKVYILDGDQLKLCWNVSLYQKDGKHWWNSYVDASNGKVIRERDDVITCNFGGPDHKSHNHESVLFDNTKMGPLTEATTTAMAPDSYNVYAMPVESPSHGSRSIVTDPANSIASPFGWHDTNGSAGAEHTITRGNNVWAQEDRNGNNGTGFSPDGGPSLDFDFPLDLSQAPNNYQSAAITNLFYWNNIVHDVFYQYGFNEASGNFQENNYGNGGSGSDSVNADAQDGSGSNKC